MPAELERKLKKEVAGKKMSKDRKDAYVYGTLRKTGWKPKREKKMSTLDTRIVRLSKIDRDLDSIIQLDDKHPYLDTAATVAGGAGLVGGGLYAAGALTPKSYGGAGLGVRSTIAKAGRDVAGIGEGGGARIGKTIGRGLTSAGSAWQKILAKLGGAAAKALESKEKSVEFESPSPISPWGGSTGHESKIDQLEFPAGLSSLTVMQMPFPQLMKYLNQRNQLQQQFSRKGRLVELSSKLDEINASTHPTK
jgi:hypothetical protein